MFDYTSASIEQLIAWWRQFRNARARMTCERGHLNCGAHGAYPGFPPCSLTVYAAMLDLLREIG